MITTILDQVSRLLGQAFLVSTFTPWLIFWIANGLTALLVVSPRAASEWWDAEIAKSAFANAALLAGVGVALAASALVMEVVYRLCRRGLEGDAEVPVLRWLAKALVRIRRWRVGEARAAAEQWNRGRAYAEDLRAYYRQQLDDAVDASTGTATLTLADRNQLNRAIAAFVAKPRTAHHVRALCAVLIPNYSTFKKEELTYQLATVQSFIDEYVSVVAIGQSRAAAAVVDQADEEPAPTEYGAVLRAAAQYVATRYGIESVVFWSRLQPVIGKEYMPVVEAAKIRMDMLTALAVLSLFYAVLWLVVLPDVGAPSQTVLLVFLGGDCRRLHVLLECG
jgi:hypothetical protein